FRRSLDVRGERLVRLFAVRPVVDQHRHALLRQLGDLLGVDLPTYQSSVVELALHDLTCRARSDLNERAPGPKRVQRPEPTRSAVRNIRYRAGYSGRVLP